MQSERGLSNRECARELYFTGGSRLLLFLSPSFYATLTPFRFLSVPPLRDPLLSDSPSPSLSLSSCLELVINYTDKLGPPAPGFTSILYELVPFHPVSFCPAPRRF